MDITTHQLMKFGYPHNLKDLTSKITNYMLVNYKKFGNLRMVVIDGSMHFILTHNQIRMLKTKILPITLRRKVNFYFEKDMNFDIYFMDKLGVLFGCSYQTISEHIIELGFITHNHTLPKEHIKNGLYIISDSSEPQITLKGKSELIIALTKTLKGLTL